MGLLTFAQRISETYPEATKEFLWTTDLADTSTIEKCNINFITRGEASFTLVTQICEVFNFKKSEETKITMTTQHKAVWQEMTGCEYSASKAKETMIRHPVIRLAHRFIANTFFSRNEMGNVTQNEMVLHTKPFVPNGQKINLGLILAKQQNDIKHTAVHYREGKPAVLGLEGVVTLIPKFYANKALHLHEALAWTYATEQNQVNNWLGAEPGKVWIPLPERNRNPNFTPS